MKKRILQKQQTRALILEKAKNLLEETGALKMNTADLARSCNISHGALFFHFKTKEELIFEIYKNKLQEIGNELYKIAFSQNQIDQLEVYLSEYLNFIAANEQFFSIVYREFAFYPLNLKREILSFELIIRNFFYTAVESGIKAGKIKKMDITTVLNFLFGLLNYYIYHRELFVKSGSVINQHSELIKNTFMQFLAV